REGRGGRAAEQVVPDREREGDLDRRRWRGGEQESQGEERAQRSGAELPRIHAHPDFLSGRGGPCLPRTTVSSDSTGGRSAGPRPTWWSRTTLPGSISTSPPS